VDLPGEARRRGHDLGHAPESGWRKSRSRSSSTPRCWTAGATRPVHWSKGPCPRPLRKSRKPRSPSTPRPHSLVKTGRGANRG